MSLTKVALWISLLANALVVLYLILFGVPPFGTPGTTTTWTVYSCPDDPDCVVNIKVTDVSGGCKIDVVDFVDRNPKQTKQQIIWRIVQVPPNYDVQFTDPGIKMTQGAGDMDDVSKDKREHKKKVKRQDPDRSFLLYNILLEYKATLSGGGYAACTPKGPAIVNRG